jgi:serine/threonine protein kinase
MEKQGFERFITFFYQSPDADKAPAALEFFVNSELPRLDTADPHTVEMLWYFFTKVAQLFPPVLRGYEAVFRKSLYRRVFILWVLAQAGDHETREFLDSCMKESEYTSVHDAISKVLDKWSPASIDALEWPIEWGGDLDFKWMEFIVTGSKDAVRRIISVLDWPDRIREKLQAWLEKKPILGILSRRRYQANKLREFAGIECDLHRCQIETADDLDCLSMASRERWEAMRNALPFRLSEVDVVYISTKEAARWSLGSFARQHPSVLEVCLEELEARRAQNGMKETVRTKRHLQEIVARAGRSGARPLAHAKTQDETAFQEPAWHSGQASDVDWSTGELLLGDFVVEAELGQGGMGKVYLVRSRSTGQRFAVKKARFGDDASRRSFLTELQTWIGLPKHPNLAACRFFRTINDEIVIFAEYLEGGSLADWIRHRRFATLEQVLDIAIQSARGLHAAHERGLVHQDVKPANFLMTCQGIAKVSDFGLARARAVAGEAKAAGEHSILISAGGMTVAYCSPEQASGTRLGRTTDIWSWGISILQMFVGKVTWRSGVEAPQVLAAYLKTGPSEARLPRMPSDLAPVLAKCFRVDPAERWASMAQVADALVQLYRKLVGQDYGRQVSSTSPRHDEPDVLHDRRTNWGVGGWPNPGKILRVAFEAEGRDPAEAAALVPKPQGSRKAQAMADLAAYQEAQRILERLVASGRKDQETRLAAHYVFQAVIHECLDDVPGALALYDRAIGLREKQLNQDGSPDAGYGLAGACWDKAKALSRMGDNQAPVALYDNAIDLYRELTHLVDDAGRPELLRSLARLYADKGDATHALGDNRAAMVLYDQAIATVERLLNQENRSNLAFDFTDYYQRKAGALHASGDNRGALALYDKAVASAQPLLSHQDQRAYQHILAAIYADKAVALRVLKDNQAAAALCDQAIAIYEPLVTQEGRHELASSLAAIYLRKADALRDSGEVRAAVPVYDQAIAIYEHLVNQEGQRELAIALAETYQHKANALGILGDNRAALALCDQAIAICERLVNSEGRPELAGPLAGNYTDKANALSALGEKQAAVALYDRAIAIQERLVSQEGRLELAEALAMTYMNKGVATRGLGDNHGAIALYDQAIAIRERLVKQEGRRELEDWLAKTYLNKGAALGFLDENKRAVRVFDQAIGILERLLKQEGRRELGADLARAYINAAGALAALANQRTAMDRLDQAITLLERLINKDGRRELTGEWATAKARRAKALLDLGRSKDARIEAREAIGMLRAECKRTGRADLQGALRWATSALAEVL